MPELPEVITIKRDLENEVVGKKIKSVKIERGYKLDQPKDYFKKRVEGSKVEGIQNVGKLLAIELSSGYYIATHLSISGRLLLNTEDKFVKITLEFTSGDKLHYSTVRMFGFFEAWSKRKLNKYKKTYGKTALDEDLTPREFAEKLKGKNTMIKVALLDQKLISGIGNIYANDALYMSKIHPRRKTDDITDDEYNILFEQTQIILKEGIKHRGSSIDRYRDLYGKPGWHQIFFRVYGKNRKECKECGTEIIFEKIQGRGTYFCPACQPEDRQMKLL